MPNEERTFTRPNDKRGITWPARRQVNPPPTLPSRPVEHVNNYGKGYISGALTEPARGGTSSTTHPFQLIDASNPDDGLQVRVVYGNVNGSAPDGMSAGDDPPYILSVSGEGVIYLGLTVDDDENITSIFLAAAASVPDDVSPYTFYIEIGSYSAGDGFVNVADGIGGSQSFSRCRDWFSFDPVTYTADWNLV